MIENFLSIKDFGNIVVVGDCMVDEYYYVSADKLSPEFPIPRMLSKLSEPDVVVPGGAGNAVMQFKNFGFDIAFISIINEYAKETLNKSGINTDNCCYIPDAILPLKRRFYDGNFPLCRWDVEQRGYGLSDEKIQNAYKYLTDMYKDVSNPFVVIFSDYNKGLFNSEKWCRIRKDVISIVDPKTGPIDKWEGCSVFKPNYYEACDLSGLNFWKDQCDFFQNKLGCVSVVITHAHEGIKGKVGGRYFEYSHKKQSPATSVIGAGDCFIAFLAMGLAKGMDVIEVVELAHDAASIYVQRKHNEPLNRYDIQRYIDPIKSKFVDPEFLRVRDFELVMVNGCFDAGLTLNHIRHLQDAKKLGDKLVVALNSDQSIRNLKGANRPIYSLEERSNIIGALECVDYVVPFDGDTPIDLVHSIMPDVLAKGADYKPEEVAGYGIVPIVITPLYEGLSTTDKIRMCMSK